MPFRPLLILSILAMIITVALPFVPLIAPLVGLVSPSAVHLALVFSIVAAYFVVTESIKMLIYRHSDKLSARVDGK